MFAPAGRFLMTEDGAVGNIEDWLHTRLYRRADGRRVLSLLHDRVSSWVKHDRYIFTEKGQVYDTETGERVSPEPGRAYPSIVETIARGRLVPGLRDGELLDARTGKWIEVHRTGFPKMVHLAPFSTASGVWVLEWADHVVTRTFIPGAPITDDPDTVNLWCEVLTRHERHPHGGPDVELTAESWERRRQELARRTRNDASPILRAVAGDRAFYYRKNLTLKAKVMASIWPQYALTLVAPGADPARYREALERFAWLYEVCREPYGASIDIVPNALGLAQFRCGLYGDAIETLTKPNTTRAASGGTAIDPCELAVVAMSRAHLGENAAARATLDQLERLMGDPKLAEGLDNARNRAFLREAEELILDPGFPSYPFEL
jgi:hypothetical protein